MSGHHAAPGIDDHPDTSRPALQALAPDILYCNVAGSGPTFPVAQDAAERARRWLNEVGMFSHAGYDAYNEWLSQARDDLAAYVGDPGGASRIALMTSATEGLNTLSLGLQIPPGSLIVTTAEEHGSALMPLHRRRERGDQLRILRYSNDAEFIIDLVHAFEDGARALVMSLVSCKSGAVLPVRAACAVARQAGVVTIIDAAQALGQIPVDVNELGADAVVTLGHKWVHGPLATGAIWVRDVDQFSVERLGWRSQAEFDVDEGYTLQPDARRFETGTIDAPAFVGLRQAIAIQRALGSLVPSRIRDLRRRLFEQVEALDLPVRSRPTDPTGIVVVEPRGGDAAGIVTGMWRDDRVVVKHLAERGVVPDGIRISFWALHTEGDIELLSAALARQLAVTV
jgi:selenocysteine lyase/cysteine desulfurase